MNGTELKQEIALKNILLATDFEKSANRALPFAVALAARCGAKLYVAHVIPQEAYDFAHPESVERILREARDYVSYALNQLVEPLKRRGQRAEVLLSEGNVAEVLTRLAQDYVADLIVVGTTSRSGLDKLLLGSTAEKIIRESPCPVLTIGPYVVTEASVGIQSIVCAVDFSQESLRAAEFAGFLAHECQAHLTLVHVVEGVIRDLPHLAIQQTERRLGELIPPEPKLRYEPETVVEVGPVADHILGVAGELSADIIVMGVRGAGASAQRASHFGSIAHEVISRSLCPVLTT